MRIIVTGSLAYDTIMNFNGRFSDHILPDKIHSLNLSFLVDEMQKTRGGTAGNMAYNLGLLKSAPVLLSTFGKDGGEYCEFLGANGVDTSVSPTSKKLYTSQSFVVTDETDNQIASFYPGSMVENKKLKISQQSAVSSQQKKINIYLQTANCKLQTFAVISPNTPEAMRNFVEECTQYNVPFMYDPGMQLPRISDVDLKQGIENCEILIGNDYEIALIKKRIGDLKPPILIVTLGEKGAIVFDNRNSVGTDLPVCPHAVRPGGRPLQNIIPPAKPQAVVDPTGSGDAFRAGFLAGYMRGFDLKVCGQMGATCAVYTVEKYGTTTHEFSEEEFCKRYEENYGEKLRL